MCYNQETVTPVSGDTPFGGSMNSDPAHNRTNSLKRASAEMGELVLLSKTVLAECQDVLQKYAVNFGSSNKAAA